MCICCLNIEKYLHDLSAVRGVKSLNPGSLLIFYSTSLYQTYDTSLSSASFSDSCVDQCAFNI